MAPIRIEAEDMTLKTYRTESESFASGAKQQLVSLRKAGLMGKASTVFTGEEGRYDVVLGYYDENDGVSQLQVSVGGVSYDWALNQNLGSDSSSPETLVRRTVATGVSLNNGTPIEIQGTANQAEWARVDYIEFIPVTSGTNGTKGTDAAETLTGNALNNTINGLGGKDTLIGGTGNETLIGGTGNDILNGGAGIDTASYAQSTSGIVADLSTGVVTRTAKIMPLGDSITYGKVNNNLENSGGYRTELWDEFKANGLTVDFVGSQSSGPDSLGDRDHEGHPGKKIDGIDDRVNGWLNTSTPDIVTLMIGTNDTRTKSVSQMSRDLSDLIDNITQQLPDTQLLVASIPPINPEEQSQTRVQRALDFNAAIPDIAGDMVAAGKNVRFVDIMTRLTVDDISKPPEDSGLHPTVIGYDKTADFWYDALLAIGVDQGTFRVDKDTLSNIENIVGTALNDTMVGGAGRNIFTGSGGADTYVHRVPTPGGDLITDFGGNDIFEISASGFGGGLKAGIDLSMTDSTTGVFVSDANPTPMGTSANFLYTAGTGVLSFDRDGIGANAAVVIATLDGMPSLSLEQFTIFA